MEPSRIFRASFKVVAAYATTVTLVALPIVTPGFAHYFGTRGYVFGLVELFAAMWIALYAMCRFLPTRVTAHGLRGTNGMGFLYTVSWDAMRSVERWPGYRVVRHGRWGTALCIPTWLSDPTGFREAIIAYAPEGNALRAHLEQETIKMHDDR